MYVCGFALPLLFESNLYHTATYILLYLTPLVIASAYLLLNSSFHHNTTLKTSTFRLDMSIMDSGIISGFESLIKICGYIVLFSIITEVLTNIITYFLARPSFILTLTLGNLEITNGVNLLSTSNVAANLKYIGAIQLLSFGGLSGIAQTGSILSEAGLSMHKYIIGKAALSLLLTLLSVIYVFIIRLL